jgi:hypothetical protein
MGRIRRAGRAQRRRLRRVLVHRVSHGISTRGQRSLHAEGAAGADGARTCRAGLRPGGCRTGLVSVRQPRGARVQAPPRIPEGSSAIRRLADHLHLRRQAAPGPRDRARRTRGAHWRRSRPPRAASSRRSRRLQPVARPKGASSSAQPSSCSSNTGSREGARSGNTRGSSAAASTAKRPRDALIEFDQRRPAQVVDRRATERPAFAGLCQSPLTDSNRRPPPYHRGFGSPWRVE